MAAVWRMAADAMREIEKWIQAHDNIRLYVHLKPDDQVRLVRLYVWSRRYGVPVSEILDIVVPPLREQMNLRRRKKRYGLGFSVAILTGPTSERILSIIVGRRYPNGEQFEAIREAERERQLEAEDAEDLEGLKAKESRPYTLLESESLQSFMTSYAQAVMTVRNRMRNEGHAKWRRRKAYRGNPWR